MLLLNQQLFLGTTLLFDVDNKIAFDIPLTDVAQSQHDKNDISLIFNKELTNTEGVSVPLFKTKSTTAIFTLPPSNSDPTL